MKIYGENQPFPLKTMPMFLIFISFTDRLRDEKQDVIFYHILHTTLIPTPICILYEHIISKQGKERTANKENNTWRVKSILQVSFPLQKWREMSQTVPRAQIATFELQSGTESVVHLTLILFGVFYSLSLFWFKRPSRKFVKCVIATWKSSCLL